MFIKKIYGFLLRSIEFLLGIDVAKIFDTLIRDKKWINLRKPETLSEKIAYIELHEQSPLASTCSDKYEVRKYIESKGLGNILVPLAHPAVWSRLEDIDFKNLPASFALKATHGCKMNYLVPDKNVMDIEKCKKEIRRWFATTYGTYSVEPHYRKIPHRVYAEFFLKDADHLIDYKIHCLNGVPRFILAVSDRKANGAKAMQVHLSLYDLNWNPIHELVPSGLETPRETEIPKPKYLSEMIRIAETLSKDFKFVRVDLYELDDKILFGELTFTPAHCIFPYFSDQFNKQMGKLLEL